MKRRFNECVEEKRRGREKESDGKGERVGVRVYGCVIRCFIFLILSAHISKQVPVHRFPPKKRPQLVHRAREQESENQSNQTNRVKREYQ